MKTMILAAAMMLLVTSFSVRASEDSTSVNLPEDKSFVTSVKLQPADIIEFRVINPGQEKVTLKIYSERNNKIYQRTIKNEEGFRLGCDMKDFSLGTYVCVIETNGHEVTRKAITLK